MRGEYILALDSCKVGPRETKVVATKRAQLKFGPSRLIIPQTVGINFDVHDVKIKARSQFRGTGAVPAAIFAEKVRGFITEEDFELFKMEALDVGDVAEIVVENKTDVEMNFTACFIGDVIGEGEVGYADDVMSMADFSKQLPKGLQGGFTEVISDEGSPLERIARLVIDANIEVLKFVAGEQTKTKGERTTMMGFDRTTVPANTHADITKRPQLIFRPKYIFIPPEVASKFTIVDIRIGKNSQTAASGEIPSAAFSNYGLIELKGDVCQVSMDMTMMVRNHTGEDAVFECVVFGPYLD